MLCYGTQRKLVKTEPDSAGCLGVLPDLLSLFSSSSSCTLVASGLWMALSISCDLLLPVFLSLTAGQSVSPSCGLLFLQSLSVFCEPLPVALPSVVSGPWPLATAPPDSQNIFLLPFLLSLLCTTLLVSISLVSLASVSSSPVSFIFFWSSRH